MRDIHCDDPSEGAALGLYALMTGISEHTYFASWLTGLEHVCWHARQNPDRDTLFGTGAITPRQARLLRDLSDEADGWWVFDEADTAPKFIRMADWRARLEKKSAGESGHENQA